MHFNGMIIDIDILTIVHSKAGRGQSSGTFGTRETEADLMVCMIFVWIL